MATTTLFSCDHCKSVDQSVEFRIEQTNFYQFTYSFYPTSGGPHMMPGADQVDYKNETFQICKDCKVAFLADVASVIDPLKA